MGRFWQSHAPEERHIGIVDSRTVKEASPGCAERSKVLRCKQARVEVRLAGTWVLAAAAAKQRTTLTSLIGKIDVLSRTGKRSIVRLGKSNRQAACERRNIRDRPAPRDSVCPFRTGSACRR